MKITSYGLYAVAIAGLAVGAATGPAHALTAQECSAKYQAAKTAGSLGGQKWNDFRKAQCSADAAPAAATTTTTAAPPKEAPKAAPKAAEKPAPAPAAAPVATGNAVFPSVVDPKYASEKPGLAREHTCSDQWKANKAANTTGGLKWNQKGGGGFYSLCNAKLKG